MTTTIETTEAPVIASIDDIDKQFAARAFHGTSFDPERRGEQRREEYANTVNRAYAEFWTLAKTDEQRAILADEMERYRQGCLSRMNAYLASHSRIASAMITGPARFPVAQMEKRNQSTNKKVVEWLEWSKRAQASIKTKIQGMRTEEVKQAELDAKYWKNAEESITLRLGILDQIDAGSDKFSPRPYYEDIICYSVRSLAKSGNVGLTEKAIALVKSYEDTHSIPAISHKNKFWKLAELAEKNAANVKAKEQEKTSKGDSEIIATGDGIEIIANHVDNRVQIMFDARPDSAMIGKLKAQGWRWAPSVGAWQRQLTNAARYSAVSITGVTQGATASE